MLAALDAQAVVYLVTSGGFLLARIQTSLPAACSLVCCTSSQTLMGGWGLKFQVEFQENPLK